MEGKSQQAAASAMSERSVRRWQRGTLPSENRRNWRTRPDPFENGWESDSEHPRGELLGPGFRTAAKSADRGPADADIPRRSLRRMMLEETILVAPVPSRQPPESLPHGNSSGTMRA